MNFSAEQIIAFGTAFAAVVGSFGALLVSLQNKRGVKEVHGLVNSEMQKAKDEIARLSQRIAGLTAKPEDQRSSEEATDRAKPHG